MVYLVLLLSLLVNSGLAATVPKLLHVSSALWSSDQPCIIPPITNEQVEAHLAAYAAENTNNAYPSDITDTTHYRDTTQYGGVSLFNYMNWGGPQKWTDALIPGRTEVTYCFMTETERTELYERVEAAVKLWIDALGGKRGRDNGHDLHFNEWYDYVERKPRLCYDPRSDNNQHWNPSLPTTTVTIRLSKEQTGGAKASMGAGSLADRGKPWKLMMTIGPDANPSVIAHELGHVLGMVTIRRYDGHY
jgi:hypothetical protein